jgi:hypothetical protein
MGCESRMAPLCPALPSAFRQNEAGDSGMLDIAYITLALVSFALFALAVRGCERL